MNYISRLLFLAALAYAVFMLIVFFLQEAIVYQPSNVDFESCTFAHPFYTVRHRDTRMYRFEGKSPEYAIIYHGNAGSACDRGGLVEMLTRSGYSVLLPEYTGYAEDGNDPTHAAIQKNVFDVIEYTGQEKMSVSLIIGESVGAGPAMMHATYSRYTAVPNLILITPFTSLADVAEATYWMFPTRLLVDNAWDNLAVVGSYTGRLLILHGTNDEIIPVAQANSLCESAGAAQEVQCVYVDGATHNTILEHRESLEKIHDFIRIAW